MATYNNTLPIRLDMKFVSGDSFTFLDEQIVIWANRSERAGFDLTPYNGTITISNLPAEPVVKELTTQAGEIVFTDNIITFDNLSLDIDVKKYSYVLKLYDKINGTLIGTFFKGNFNVIDS